MLWLTVPMAMMWSGVTGAGGVLVVIAHALLVVLYLTTFDARVMGAGLEPRVALTRGRASQTVGLSRVISAVVGVGVGLVCVLLLFESKWMAGLCAAGGVLIVVLVGRSGRASLGWRMRWAEFLWAGVVVVGPMVVIRANALSLLEKEIAEFGNMVEGFSDTVVMTHGAVWSSVLGAVGVGVYVLLCMARDAAIDTSDGIKTSATGLGAFWSRVAVSVWLIAGVAVAAFIAANGVLGGQSWGIVTVFGVTALVTQGMVWARETDRAVVVWWFGAGLVGLLSAGALG